MLDWLPSFDDENADDPDEWRDYSDGDDEEDE